MRSRFASKVEDATLALLSLAVFCNAVGFGRAEMCILRLETDRHGLA